MRRNISSLVSPSLPATTTTYLLTYCNSFRPSLIFSTDGAMAVDSLGCTTSVPPHPNPPIHVQSTNCVHTCRTHVRSLLVDHQPRHTNRMRCVKRLRCLLRSLCCLHYCPRCPCDPVCRLILTIPLFSPHTTCLTRVRSLLVDRPRHTDRMG